MQNITWTHICSISDLCFVNMNLSNCTVEISRRNGIPQHVKFSSVSRMQSFLSLLDGYYRLMEKWTVNLCINLPTPSLTALRAMRCHGPVGAKFAYQKLQEKSGHESGWYLLRQSSSAYREFRLDFLGHNDTPETLRIVRSAEGGSFRLDEKEGQAFPSLAKLVNDGVKPMLDLELGYCVPPSEYDKTQLLLCRAPGSGSENPAHVREPRECVHSRSLVFTDNRKDELHGKFTVVRRAFLRKVKGQPREFMAQCDRMLFWQCEAVVSSVGMVHSGSFGLVLEFLPLGSLDIYLRQHKLQLQAVDLVEAAKGLARALWYLVRTDGILLVHLELNSATQQEQSKGGTQCRLTTEGLFCLHPGLLHVFLPWILRRILLVFTNLCVLLLRSTMTVQQCTLPIFLFFLCFFFLVPLRMLHVGAEKRFELLEERCRDSVEQKHFVLVEQTVTSSLCFKRQRHLIYSFILPQCTTRGEAIPTLRSTRKPLSAPPVTPAYPRTQRPTSCPPHQPQPRTRTAGPYTSEQRLRARPRIPASFWAHCHYLDSVSLVDAVALYFQDSDDASEVTTSAQHPAVFQNAISFGNTSPMTEVSASPWVIDSQQLVKGKPLGQGFFGEVYAASLKKWAGLQEEVVAVKCMRKTSLLELFQSESGLRDLQREIEIMKNLRHPNIVEIKGLVEEPEMMLVMEFLEMGSLLTYLQTYQTKISHPQLVKYSEDIANGMEYLEEKHIVHRDLAARNILVASKDLVKISDFGLAQFTVDHYYYIHTQNRKLPMKWYAPESILYGKFSTKSDVWSYGVTLWEMFSYGEDPVIQDVAQENLGAELLDGKRLPCPPNCPSDIYRLMQLCWTTDSHQRPGFAQVKNFVRDL
ncbi:unnamed protein product [Ixodes hexagonus]